MSRTAGQRRRKKRDEADKSIAPYPQEALLIAAVPEIAGTRVLCTSAGLAQFAGAVAEALPETSVVCSYLDLYRANLATAYWRDKPPNLQIECATDLPDEEADVVAFPFSGGGEAELTRELIQAGHERLRIGGRMFASTENRKDKWLGEVLAGVFRKLERRATNKGVLYVGTKTQPIKKLKNYACEFAFRDRGRLIHAFSRPGVFSHRQIDPGARQLIEEMEITPGARVLDIGCGSGVVSLAAAVRAEGVTVHAVDSNSRAIECTQRGAELNALIGCSTTLPLPPGEGRGEGKLLQRMPPHPTLSQRERVLIQPLTNITTELNAIGKYAGAGSYDIALANPPYYAGFRIAQHFLTTGHEALRPGGQIFLVTKLPDWYHEHMPNWYRNITVQERKGYFVVRGVKA